MLFKLIALFFSLHLSCLQALRVEDLTLEDKVGQVLMVWMQGSGISDDARALIHEGRVGGILYYKWANGLTRSRDIFCLSSSLQTLAKEEGLPPLLIAIDAEGGKVAPLKGCEGFTDVEGNGALGQSGEPQRARKEALRSASELRRAGINLNLAPVVDINNNKNNPVIGSRSFGADPNRVAEFGKAALQGYLQGGVLACLKHFPGHGDVTIDSHLSLPIVNKTLVELKNCELIPFAELAKEAPCILTAHILFPQVDPDHPASLSHIWLSDILRKEMGFTGVILTDSLTMRAVLQNNKTIAEAALEAFLAGSDILLVGGTPVNPSPSDPTPLAEVFAIRKALLEAIRSGALTEERLNQSVERILRLKTSL